MKKSGEIITAVGIRKLGWKTRLGRKKKPKKNVLKRGIEGF